MTRRRHRTPPLTEPKGYHCGGCNEWHKGRPAAIIDPGGYVCAYVFGRLKARDLLIPGVRAAMDLNADLGVAKRWTESVDALVGELERIYADFLKELKQ